MIRSLILSVGRSPRIETLAPCVTLSVRLESICCCWGCVLCCCVSIFFLSFFFKKKIKVEMFHFPFGANYLFLFFKRRRPWKITKEEERGERRHEWKVIQEDTSFKKRERVSLNSTLVNVKEKERQGQHSKFFPKLARFFRRSN